MRREEEGEVRREEEGGGDFATRSPNQPPSY